MTARGISSVKSHNFFLRFTMALASAVLEWLLISMLFIDAIFSYLVTKFARYCKLQVPCLLCSRLDHVLGNEKLGFYWDLICGDHKFEISSFVLCRVHNKLADVHRMCESCLFSFATINKSNSETYRLLVGKLGADSHLGLEDHKLGSPRTRNCSCCNEPWILRSNAQNLLQTVSIGSEVAELEVPLSQKSVTESGEVIEAESRPVTKSETTSEINPVINGTNSLMPNTLDLCDAYKFAVKGRQLSGKLSEQMSLKDGRLSEDLKLLLSQISVTRGIELPLNDMSPRVSGNRNEPKTDSSSSIGIQMLQRRISLERNESGLSVDGSVISEIEGESEIDRLKRQVEHDKKLLSALYKELEEERNASAISANQAMAMITRLQEEKAALNMEALQCVRMMEEQAEYDEEALQKANDFLAEREKEIQDLEAELELYRNKVGNTSILENELDSTCDLKPGEVRAEHSDTSYFKNSANEQTNNKPLVCNKVDGTGVLFGEKHTNNACNSLLEFDDERLYILHCLKKLEKKLHLFSNDGIYLDKANGEYSGTKGDRVSDLKELNCKGCTQENSEKQENDLSMQKHISVSVPSFQNPEFVSKVSSEFDSDVVALGDAVSNLISRLEALEADHNSFDHFSKSLRMGDDEIKIHSGDILSHVREL
ncbi:hypothetical protein CsSME_00023617 [Camellia sinensis var. sinensis]